MLTLNQQEEKVIDNIILLGSVSNFVFLSSNLIPEVECGQSPQYLINTEKFLEFLTLKISVNTFSETQNYLHPLLLIVDYIQIEPMQVIPVSALSF